MVPLSVVVLHQRHLGGVVVHVVDGRGLGAVGHEVTVFNHRCFPQSELHQYLNPKPQREVSEPLDREEVEEEVERVGGVRQHVGDLFEEVLLSLAQSDALLCDVFLEGGHEEDALRQRQQEEGSGSDNQHQRDHVLGFLLLLDEVPLSFDLIPGAAFPHQTPPVSPGREERHHDVDVESDDGKERDEQVQHGHHDGDPGVLPEGGVVAERAASSADSADGGPHEEPSGGVGDEEADTDERRGRVAAGLGQEDDLLQGVAD